MAERVSVYMPDDLAAEARAAGLNVSALCQQALRDALSGRRQAELADQMMAALEPALIPDTPRSELRMALIGILNRARI